MPILNKNPRQGTKDLGHMRESRDRMKERETLSVTLVAEENESNSVEDECVQDLYTPQPLCWTTILEQCKHGDSHNNMLAMHRFLAESSSEQYALFVRPDNGILSTSRERHCENSLEISMLEISDDDEDEKNKKMVSCENFERTIVERGNNS